MNIECIDKESAFLSLRTQWEDLRLASEIPSFFLSHDWVRCCWEEIKLNNVLRIFVVRKQERIVLIAPCMLTRTFRKPIPLNTLCFIMHPETQIAGFLISRDSSGRGALTALLHYLLTMKRREWSLLVLDKVPNHSLTARFFREGIEEDNVQQQICANLDISHEAAFISLDKTWQAYLTERSVRFRKTLRNVTNRLTRCGHAQVKMYQGKSAVKEAIEKLFAVSNESWKAADGIAITSCDKRMQFFRDLMNGEETTDRVRVVILELDGKPIASETQIVDGGTVYALRSDYADRYASISPGTYLQGEILKDLFASSHTEYNFGVGLNAYKSHWTEARHQLLRVEVYNQTLRGRLLGTAYRWESKIRHFRGVRRLSQVPSTREE